MRKHISKRYQCPVSEQVRARSFSSDFWAFSRLTWVGFLLCDLVEPRPHIQLRTLAPDRLGLFGEAQPEAGRICGKPEELSERTEFHEYVCVGGFVAHGRSCTDVQTRLVVFVSGPGNPRCQVFITEEVPDTSEVV